MEEQNLVSDLSNIDLSNIDLHLVVNYLITLGKNIITAIITASHGSLFIALFFLACLVPSAGLLLAGPGEPAANEAPAAAPRLRTTDGSWNGAFFTELADYAEWRCVAEEYRHHVIPGGVRLSRHGGRHGVERYIAELCRWSAHLGTEALQSGRLHRGSRIWRHGESHSDFQHSADHPRQPQR